MSKTYSAKGTIAREIADAIAQELVKVLPDTQIVGSLCRGCPIVGDVDLLTTSTIAMEVFANLVDQVFVQGDAKVSGRSRGGAVPVSLDTGQEGADQ